MSIQRIVVIGGVAGGMSCAARARRLNEDTEIVVLERGPYVSFANCGLPYHVGGEIPERSKLILRTPEALEKSLRIDVRVLTEAMGINRENKTVRIRHLETEREEDLPYDALVISTGAEPMRPPIPGIDREGIFTLRNIPDMDRILVWLNEKKARTAVVVGGGYIGLEIAEQLQHRGLKVSVAEALPQIMQPLDPEMALKLQAEMEKHGIDIYTNDGVERFEGAGDGKTDVVLKSGRRLAGDVVLLGMGVRPDIPLAKGANLEIGELGGIRVDDHMRTSDPDIYAIGDAIEVRDGITREWALVPLAGPANRQGRIAADNIFGRPSAYRGTWGTAGIRIYSLVAACTGLNEKRLKQLGWEYRCVQVQHGSHVGYYPGAKPISLKLLFSPKDGRLYGAQAVGEEDVPRRIDVMATAIMAEMNVEDLGQLELCYAPPFGAAKDVVNQAGMAAENIYTGLVESMSLGEIPFIDPGKDVILDVRNPPELEAIPPLAGAIHIPQPELRDRLDELPRDKRLLAHCASGQRSYFAVRTLQQKGFNAVNLTGSLNVWDGMIRKEARPGSG